MIKHPQLYLFQRGNGAAFIPEFVVWIETKTEMKHWRQFGNRQHVSKKIEDELAKMGYNEHQIFTIWKNRIYMVHSSELKEYNLTFGD